MDRSFSFDPRSTINLPVRSKARSFMGNDTLALIEQTLFSLKEREKKTNRNTAIICTIGPASCHVQTLERLIAAGMNVARLNMAHSSHEQLVDLIRSIRAATQAYTLRTGANVSVAIAMETQGFQKRTGKLENNLDEIVLKKGTSVTITTNPEFKEKCNADVIYINGKKSVSEKSEIILDDLIHLKVESISKEEIRCTVVNSGHLGNWKKVCFPGELDDTSSCVEIEEKKDLEFAVDQDVDIIILSHVMNAASIIEARTFIAEKGKPISLVAKLRTMSAMRNMKEIIHEVDGIMVAREELGIIFQVEKVFVALKNIITYCVRVGKPVICASVMLHSMVRCPRATQAESSDIANVVLDGVDCVVLSGETAIGNYPLESLRTMVKICNEAEDLAKHRLSPMDPPLLTIMDPMNTLALTAIDTALKCSAAAIMVITFSGRTAHMIARYRPDCLLIMVTRQVSTANQSHLYRSIHPILCDIQSQDDVRKDIDAQVQFGILQSKKKRLLEPGNQIVIIIGRQLDKSLMHTVRIEDVV